METSVDISIIHQMLAVEKNACQIIEEARETGNRLISEARSESKRLLESTKKELSENAGELERKIQADAEKEVKRIKSEKKNIMELVDKQAELRKEMAVKRIIKFLFKEVLEDLC